MNFSKEVLQFKSPLQGGDLEGGDLHDTVL